MRVARVLRGFEAGGWNHQTLKRRASVDMVMCRDCRAGMDSWRVSHRHMRFLPRFYPRLVFKNSILSLGSYRRAECSQVLSCLMRLSTRRNSHGLLRATHEFPNGPGEEAHRRISAAKDARTRPISCTNSHPTRCVVHLRRTAGLPRHVRMA